MDDTQKYIISRVTEVRFWLHWAPNSWNFKWSSNCRVTSLIHVLQQYTIIPWLIKEELFIIIYLQKGLLLLMLWERFKGYHCELGMLLCKWRVTWNYSTTPFNIILSSSKTSDAPKTPHLACRRWSMAVCKERGGENQVNLFSQLLNTNFLNLKRKMLTP